MKKCAVMPCLLFALAISSYFIGVNTTPLPPRIYVGDDPDEKVRSVTETNALTKNKIRTKRGIPCPCVDDTECEWKVVKPCGCDPCDAIRNANEARMLRKQHRKIVAEMKMNRLKRKLHTAVCPPCALAHEREMEHNKPCSKPHVDVTVVVPGPHPYPPEVPEEPIHEYPMLPPPRPSYNREVMETGSKAIQMEQFSEPDYGEPMVPDGRYERPVSGFGPAFPWMRSSAPVEETADKKIPVQEVERDSKRRRTFSEERKTQPLQELPGNTTVEPPVLDSDKAWPVKNGTNHEATLHLLSKEETSLVPPQDARPFYPNSTKEETSLVPPQDARPFYPNSTKEKTSLVPPQDARPFYPNSTKEETSLVPPPPDVSWQTAYSAASRAVASVLNDSVPLYTKPSNGSSVKLTKNCSGGQCTELCLGAECLKREARQKRDTFGMPWASVLLTGLVSAIIGV